MSTITMDFRHNYQRGERRDSDQDTYQWDLGHVLEIYVPVTATYEIHYCRPGFTETEDYAVESCTASDDGGYKLTAHVPNKYFEESGRLQLFIVGAADSHIITTYEGYINIISRVEPDDYTDDDPENGAVSIIAKAREYANQSEAWAVGEIEGEAVPSTAPQYHNNSEYYAGLAAGSASDASDSAGAASGSASSASTNALKAEGYAVGKQNGTDVASGSDYYHNNAKYYCDLAGDYAEQASHAAIVDQAMDGTSQNAVENRVIKSYVDTAAANILGNFATVETTTTASQAYAIGSRLIYNGVLYRVTTAIALGGTIVTTGNNANVVAVTVDSEMKRRRIWFKNITVSAQATEGTLIDAQDADIDSDYILEGGDGGIHWGDSSKITTLSRWSTDTPGHFIVTGTCSAQTTATFALVLAEKQHDYTT